MPPQSSLLVGHDLHEDVGAGGTTAFDCSSRCHSPTSTVLKPFSSSPQHIVLEQKQRGLSGTKRTVRFTNNCTTDAGDESASTSTSTSSSTADNSGDDDDAAVVKVVIPIPAASDFSEEERAAMWMTNRELQGLQDQLRVDIMRASMKSHDTGLTRGLEWKTFEGSQQRMRTHKKGLKAVLDEQRHQREQQRHVEATHKIVLDAERISSRYQATIGYCQLSAQAVGGQDALAVSKEARTERMSPKSSCFPPSPSFILPLERESYEMDGPSSSSSSSS